jgi:hypothetical protein
MKSQPRLNKKWTVIYSLAVVLLLVSTFVLTLQLDTKLRFFCTIDDDHIAENPPIWIPGRWPRPIAEYVEGHWTNPTTGAKLTMITIWEAIDGGTWLYYDNIENIFWIGVQTGPMKGAVYGPYPGILWTLTNIINPLALASITLSIIALVYRPTRKLWTKTHTTTAAAHLQPT